MAGKKAKVRRRVGRRPTEHQMIVTEAKLLKKMMRPSESSKLRRLRQLRLTDSSRLSGQPFNDSIKASREVVKVG